MKNQSVYPLRLPKSIKAEVERCAKEDGTSINQFVAVAVAEKLSAMATEKYFKDKKQKANFEAFDKIMSRKTGEKPQKGDEVE